jgi:hypothetical protein
MIAGFKIGTIVVHGLVARASLRASNTTEAPTQPVLAIALCFTPRSRHPPTSFRETGAVTTLPGVVALFPSRAVVAIANAAL